MIVRVEKKIVLILGIALVALLMPLAIAKTGILKAGIDSGAEVNYQAADAPNSNSGSTCGGGSSCGCGCGGAGTAKPKTNVDTQQTGDKIKDAQNAGYKYYADKYGDSNVEAKATDYGCHVGVDILKNGQIIKRLGYSGGSVFEQ